MKYKNILWDWNGTLMDDVSVALDAVNIMLTRRGLKQINMEQYYDYIDTPIIRFYEKCFDMTVDSETTLLPEFQREYASLSHMLPVDTSTYDTVCRLHTLGIRQFIVSSSHERILRDWIKKYGIDGFIDGVTGAADLTAGSKVYRAQCLMKEHELDKESTVFIGDTLHDFETATALGIDCILVTYGHQSPTENKKTGCVTADGLNEILELFEE